MSDAENITETMDHYDALCATLSKAEAILVSLLANDHLHCLGEETLGNVIWCVEDLVTDARRTGKRLYESCGKSGSG